MKKILSLFIVLAGFSASAFGDNGPWLLRVSAGPAWISPDDLNMFLADYVKIREADAGSSARGAGFQTLGRAAEFELTVLIPLEPRIHLLASFGVLRAATEGNECVVTYPAVEATYVRDDRIRSLFGRLGIAYTLPLSGRFILRPYAAGELYLTTFADEGSWSYVSLSEGERILWMDWEVETRAFNPGFSAGVEFEVEVARPVRFSVDAGFRKARLTGFKGDFHYDWNFPGGGFSEDEVDRPLFYYEYSDAGQDADFGTLKMPDIWGGHRLTLVRDAVIDLSGLYLKAGLSVSF
jgi:hypothetical protein